MNTQASRYARIKRAEKRGAWLMVLITLLIIVFAEDTILSSLHESAYYYLSGFVAISLVSLFFNYRTFVLTAFGCTGILALFLKLNLDANQSFALDNHTEELVVQLINLELISDEVDRQRQLFRSLDADVLIFQGYNPLWRSIINTYVDSTMMQRVPYNRIDLYGQLILSRKPITFADTIVQHDIPMINLAINLNDGDRLNMISFILPPPLTSRVETQQKAFINQLIFAKSTSTPTLIVGNFNLTPWSDKLQLMKYKTNTKSSRVNKSKLNLIQENPFDYNPSMHMLYNRRVQNTFFDELEYNSVHIGVTGSYQIKK